MKLSLTVATQKIHFLCFFPISLVFLTSSIFVTQVFLDSFSLWFSPLILSCVTNTMTLTLVLLPFSLYMVDMVDSLHVLSVGCPLSCLTVCQSWCHIFYLFSLIACLTVDCIKKGLFCDVTTTM